MIKLFSAKRFISTNIENVSFTHNRKKTFEKENEEERPIVQTLFIAGCFYNTAKRLKNFQVQIFKYLNI